jgi:hypothetical protein
VAFNLKTLEICFVNNYALEHLCWHVPEFSVLWRPFVVYSPMSWSASAWVAYCGIVLLALVWPLLRGIAADLQALRQRLRDEYSGPGRWRF